MTTESPIPATRTGDSYDIVKWLGLAAMIADHTAVALLDPDTLAYDTCRTAGRLAIPFFTWVLVIRIARSTNPSRTGQRAIVRLVAFGLAAAPFVAVVDRPMIWIRNRTWVSRGSTRGCVR